MQKTFRTVVLLITSAVLALAVSGATASADQAGPGPSAPASVAPADQGGPGV